MLLRQDRIIHTAFRLFCQNGIDSVSICDIAKASKVSEKSIYRYFSTKRDLLVRTILVLWREIVNELYVDIDDHYRQATGYEQVKILLYGFRHLFENHSNYVLFSYEYKLFLIRHSSKITVDEFNDTLQPIQDLYTNALKKGFADGSINASASANAFYVSIWGMMRGFVVKIVIYSRMYDGLNLWKEQFDIVCGLILSGLRHGLPELTK